MLNNKNENEVEMPLSYWFELCKNNIYKYATSQMTQSGIPVDLQPTIIECVLSKFRKDAIDQMVNSNAIRILNSTNNSEEVKEDNAVNN